MTNIVTNWPQIVAFAQEYGLPERKKRAIIREYLQAKIVAYIYDQKAASGLFFVGGTALRLLYGLDRFSEDLDFDAPKASSAQIKKILLVTVKRLEQENIILDFYQNPGARKSYYEFRFGDLLFDLGISPNKSEKLVVKFDFEPFWKKQTAQTMFFNRYGYLASVVTKTLDQFVVEKLVAFLERLQTEARDVYDLVWLASQGAKVDEIFARENGYSAEKLVKDAAKKFAKEKISVLEQKLKPFLVEERNLAKVSFFPRFLTPATD